MDLVIDASAILAVLLNEPERDSLIEATRGVNLIAPESIPFEVGSALSSLLKRKALGLVDTLAVYHAFVAIPVRFVHVDIPASIQIAAESGIYAYDAYVLSCAASFDASLLSLDKGLKSAARERGMSLLEV
jgi:predicted nucleic acid-binding protein